MDHVERLKKYMAHIGMPSTVFADTAGIPRPTLSQIINGRNKKISNEIIAKLHYAFPTLNVMWLLFGQGDMEVTGNIETSEAQNRQNLYANTSQQDENKGVASQYNIDFTPHTKPSEKFEGINFEDGTDISLLSQEKSVSVDGADDPGEPMRHESAANGVQNGLHSNADLNNEIKRQFISISKSSGETDSRHIKSIIVLYSDNSFEVFQTANK